MILFCYYANAKVVNDMAWKLLCIVDNFFIIWSPHEKYEKKKKGCIQKVEKWQGSKGGVWGFEK